MFYVYVLALILLITYLSKALNRYPFSDHPPTLQLRNVICEQYQAQYTGFQKSSFPLPPLTLGHGAYAQKDGIFE